MSEAMSDHRSELVNLTRDEKLALLSRLSRQRQASSSLPDFSGGNESYPLTFSQERLLFLHHLEGGVNVHTQFRAMWLDGPLDLAALDAAWVEIVTRHEALRTRFEGGGEEARQVVAPPPETVVEFVDLEELPAEQLRAAAQELAASKAREPFDLEAGPVLRVTLVRMGREEHALIVGLHHIVSDGWSRGLLLAEMAALYDAFTGGGPSPLPPVRAQLGAFARWQRRRMSGERLQAELDFWSARLRGAPPRLELPTDRPRRGLVTPRGGIESLELPAEVADGLRRLARRAGATPFMAMLALYDAFLFRYSGKREVVVGLPVASRDHTELETAIGCFASTFVQRIQGAVDGSFNDLLNRVKGEISAVLPHAEVPFEKVVEAVAPQRDFSHNPVFQVMFALQEVGEDRFTLAGLEVSSLVVERAMANVDLTLELVDAGGRGALRGFFDYALDLFDATTIQRMVGHLGRLAESIVASPDSPLSRLPILAPEERQELLTGWAAPPSGELLPPVHLRFAAGAQEWGDAVAMVDGDRLLSYTELDRRANRLARLLRQRGVGADVPVGVCFARSTELMICLLAVLKAGGAYLPLDPTYPRQRLELMIEDSQTTLVLSEGEAARRLPKASVGSSAPQLLLLDRGPFGILHEVEARSAEALEPVSGLDNLAYLIYTSGSTGKPKAVAVPHRGLTHHASALRARLRLAPGKRFLYSASISFDVAAEEIYPTWLSGATLEILPPGPFPSLADLQGLIEQRRLNTINLPTPYWHEWVSELKRTRATVPSSLDSVLVGTEQASAERLIEWLELVGERPAWINAYGPTEATVSATTFIPRSADAEGMTRVPIGQPIEGARAYILDPHFEPLPIGLPGELFLAGPGVVRGYLRRPALTAAAFVPNPFAELAGQRLYATGDRARYRLGGNIEFLGRGDDQVKIRGFRIELGEISEGLRSHPNVADCAVLVATQAGGGRLIAYVVVDPTDPTSGAELTSHLAARLPAYMVPEIRVVADLPLTSAGKVDRLKLATMAARREEAEAETVAPSGPLEEAVAAIWCEVLATEEVGADDDFFEIGGHSLLATRIIARLKQVLDVEIGLPAFFEARTVVALSVAVAQARTAGKNSSPPIVPVPREGGVVCSFAQQRQWFLHQLLPDNVANNIPQLLAFRGALQVAALQRSLAGLVRRHEVLRTTFAMVEEGTNAGQPMQFVAPPERAATVALPVVDLSRISDRLGLAQGEAVAQRLATVESLRPFNLATGPLLRAHLLRLSGDYQLLYFCTHHIVSDGVSIGLTLRDWVTLYAAEVSGRPARLPELPIHYADYAAWQRTWLEGEALEEQLDYWRAALDGAPGALDLPLDRPRPAVEEARGKRHYLRLGEEDSAALAALGRRHGATSFMTLAAFFNVLLSRWSGARDVVIGWPIGGRNSAEVENLVGFLANILVMRTDLSGSPSSLDVLSRVRKGALGAYDHQELPFEQLVKELHPERDLSRHPIFQSFFVLHHPAGQLPEVEGVEVTVPSFDNGTSRLDLLLSLMHTQGGLHGFFEFNSDLFDATTIDRLSRQFKTLVAAAVATPRRPVEELPLLDAAARHQLVRGWNDSVVPLVAEATEFTVPIHRLVEQRAAATPLREAVRFHNQSLTYAELDARANRWAHSLLEHEVMGRPVAVALERSLELVVALLAVLKAGGAYLPLDPAFPSARLDYMVRDSGARTLLTEPGLRHLFLAAEEEAEREGKPLRVIEVEPGYEGLPEPLAEVELPEVDPAQLAYLIYTSGSTGLPKGVEVPHAAVVNLLTSMAAAPGLDANDTLLAITTVAFDIHALEIWLPLIRGARIQLADGESAADGVLLRRLLEDSEANVMQATPATWRALLAAGWTGGRGLRALCGGEALAADLALQVGERVGSLVNVYGPTETTVWSALEFVQPPGAASHRAESSTFSATPSIGRPIGNTQLYVVDERLEPVPVGVIGELLIGGDGVVRGYHARPALTATSFIPDSLASPPNGHPPGDTARGARLYRTGDLCRRLADGRLLFVGRRDSQVKVRGFRIELGEVEAAVEHHPGVAAAVAAVHRSEADGEAQLVAYFVARPQAPGGAPRVGALRAALREQLPDYMIPSLFILLEELPLTPNGKVDRKNLPNPELERSTLGTAYEPPRGEVEEAVAAMWREVLRLDQVGRHDRFFDIGGHSLMAMQILSRVTRRFGVELPLRAVFEKLTVAALSELIVTTEFADTDEELLSELMKELDDGSTQGELDG